MKEGLEPPEWAVEDVPDDDASGSAPGRGGVPPEWPQDLHPQLGAGNPSIRSLLTHVWNIASHDARLSVRDRALLARNLTYVASNLPVVPHDSPEAVGETFNCALLGASLDGVCRLFQGGEITEDEAYRLIDRWRPTRKT